MRVTEIKTVPGEMLRGAGEAVYGVRAFQIFNAHFGDLYGVIAECAGDDLGVLPVVGNVADGRERHIAADSTGFLVCHSSQRIRKLAVAAGVISARFGVAGDEQRYFGRLLQYIVVLSYDCRGRGVVATAGMTYSRKWRWL